MLAPLAVRCAATPKPPRPSRGSAASALRKKTRMAFAPAAFWQESAYDGRGRLLSVRSDGEEVERYAYDEAGNILKKTVRRLSSARIQDSPV